MHPHTSRCWPLYPVVSVTGPRQSEDNPLALELVGAAGVSLGATGAIDHLERLILVEHWATALAGMVASCPT